MIKNDYRRSLILLRPHAQGYSGHVRLERRTLIGTMYAVVSVPATGGELCTVLVRRDPQDAYFAVRLGELRRDGRGQATLACSFDPRNIDGRTLEEYQLIAVVEKRFETCDVVLSGNVNGSQEVNWNSVRAAACSVCACVGSPAGDVCPPRPQPMPPEDHSEPDGGTEFLTPDGECPPEVPSRRDGEPERRDEAETPLLPEASRSREEGSGATLTAADALNADLTAPWPGVSEQLRSLFRTEPLRELMLGDDHVYIRAPMPEDSGYDHVEIGVRARDGAPVSVAYALPSRFSPEPPPGLEDYKWKGGASEGWWVLYTDPESGEPLG